jgi:hypothetical protein
MIFWGYYWSDQDQCAVFTERELILGLKWIVYMLAFDTVCSIEYNSCIFGENDLSFRPSSVV